MSDNKKDKHEKLSASVIPGLTRNLISLDEDGEIPGQARDNKDAGCREHEQKFSSVRFAHRDRAEKLLACFEAIDDDIIAEAAQAVSPRPIRKFSWLNMGNAAAVLIGAVAVSCVLMLAFWLSNMGEVPAGYENSDDENGHYADENGDYAEEPPTPTPEPDEPPIFPYGLPLPRLHHSWNIMVMESDRSHLSINNPWHDVADYITELPVFLHHMQTIPGGWQTIRNQRISDEEWDAYLAELMEKAMWIAYLSGLDVEYADGNVSEHFISWAPHGLDVFMDMHMSSTHMRISFPEDTVRLPAGASLFEDSPEAQLHAALDYLTGLFHNVLEIDTPTLTEAEILLEIGGPMTYSRQRFFDAGGSPVEAILAYSFEWVEVHTFQPDRPQWMHISTFPQQHFEGLQLGNFPVISDEEAREMLIQGYFLSERSDLEWPGMEAALEALVELVYLFHDKDIIMPFYRFLLEVDLPLWFLEMNEPGEWRAVASYYVPAIHRDYLMPMTRREIPEPMEAPTGPRALPSTIFREAQTRDWADWGRPLRIPRSQVEELWQEILDDIGGLQVNEAYQFRTACGHYAMITGSRNLTGHAELMRYYPELGLPERVGDFILGEIVVNDRTNSMVIFNQPMPPSEHFFYGTWMPSWSQDLAPLNEKFTRDLSSEGRTIASAFYAMYENSAGVQVGFGVSQLFMDLIFLPDWSSHVYEIVDMDEYGAIFFQGSPGNFYRALYEPDDPWGNVLELWFIGGPIEGRFNYIDMMYNHYDRNRHLFTPVPQEDLEDLVRLFNPAALAQEYQWSLMSWQ